MILKYTAFYGQILNISENAEKIVKMLQLTVICSFVTKILSSKHIIVYDWSDGSQRPTTGKN